MRIRHINNSLKYIKFYCLFFLIITGFVFSNSEKTPDFTFGIIADIQYCECDPLGTRFYSNSLHKLSECVSVFNAEKLSFVVQLGDLIDRDFDSFDPVLSVFNTLKTKKYHVLGNHDFNVQEAQKVDVLQQLSLETRYYEFKIQGWRFIVLDGNDLSFYISAESNERTDETITLFQKLKDREANNALEWNGGLSSAQISWLENILKQASFSREKVLLFCHFPIFPSREENLWNDIELIALLESYPCVSAFFSGHLHAGNYAKKKGIHYLTFQGMVETEDSNAYSIIEVFTDHMKVSGFGREPNRILTFKKDKFLYEK